MERSIPTQPPVARHQRVQFDPANVYVDTIEIFLPRVPTKLRAEVERLIGKRVRIEPCYDRHAMIIGAHYQLCLLCAKPSQPSPTVTSLIEGRDPVGVDCAALLAEALRREGARIMREAETSKRYLDQTSRARP